MLLGLLLSGCVIESDDPEVVGPCGGVACSENGYCDAGECKCAYGYVGDPYAAHGCSKIYPESECETTCGLNSYCDAGACVCAEGFIAICGTGDCLAGSSVCDGVADCPNEADEAQETCNNFVVQTWNVQDDCDDGEDTQWRIWTRDKVWVWPNIDEVFVTRGLGVLTSESIECLEGEIICLGGAAPGAAWGVGVNASMTCDGCCFTCSSGTIDYGALVCPD